MLYFLVIQKTSISGRNIISEEFQNELNDYIPNAIGSIRGKWESKSRETVVYYWMRVGPNFEGDYFIHQTENGIRLFNGWINDGNPLRTKLSRRETQLHVKGYSGEYVYIELNEEGVGSINRSLTGSVQMYYAVKPEYSLLSNRASLLSAIVNKGEVFTSTIDRNYMAWISTTSWALDDSTLFKNVSILRQGVSVRFDLRSCGFTTPADDIWHDETLVSQYSSDKKRYWDECYELLITDLDFLFDAFDEPFDMPLSGGKDSRLLLGLVLASKGSSLLTKIHTHGPPYSGEVVTARLIASSLKLPHYFNDDNYVSVSFDGKLGQHLFSTETEVSPMDLSSNYAKQTRGMVLRGQESALRNIGSTFGNEMAKIKEWFTNHFEGFNRGGILNSRYVNSHKEFFDRYLETEKRKVRRADDLFTKNRLETRFLRWGGRIWTVHNTNEFSPFIFLDPGVVKRTYNAGAVARSEEIFHYEMLRRANPTLIEIPFFGQRWNKKYGIKQLPFSPFKPDLQPLRGSNAILKRNWEHIKKFILRKSAKEFLADVIEVPKLDQIAKANIQPGLYQPLWQLFQCAMLADLNDFKEQSLLSAANHPGFPTLRDEQKSSDLREVYKTKADKYGNMLLDLLVEKTDKVASNTSKGMGILQRLKNLKR